MMRESGICLNGRSPRNAVPYSINLECLECKTHIGERRLCAGFLFAIQMVSSLRLLRHGRSLANEKGIIISQRVKLGGAVMP